ncbi:MAG: hypothetical protein JEZ00_06365 [Anaerolineaceae bacterium]|nr:hypothetical protein [Anaerolineaceae bacterium]
MKTNQALHQITEEVQQGMMDQSPELKIPCEVYSRVVGYLRPVQNWNNGKQQEFAERKTFRLKGESSHETR